MHEEKTAKIDVGYNGQGAEFKKFLKETDNDLAEALNLWIQVMRGRYIYLSRVCGLLVGCNPTETELEINRNNIVVKVPDFVAEKMEKILDEKNSC